MANEGRSFSYQTGQQNSFSIVDYVLFAATLVISTLIGFYYAFKDRNNASTMEFLLAGGAVGMAAHVYVPVFYNLKVTSAYEVS
ncbi:hypothetical protein CHS0354_005639 [Potamilus streckersoni]|uniref:Uncharacterized protein n=1 Tax=Potamilus streckersoni TaxID=2493646 RepID=A0AAE0S0H8_9BIVA|nr:hypothetical protein CHS0354_005639 [Potamilus streckersoni]